MGAPEYLFIALVLWGISLITFVAVRSLSWRHREKEIEARRAEAQLHLPQQGGPTLEQMHMLEDRLRVLERIVTDRGYNLAHEIEALRGCDEVRDVEGTNS